MPQAPRILRALGAMTAQPPRARRRTAWALLITAALVFKSFIPLLAAVAAGMQGKEVADICSIYGVRLAATQAHVHHASHAMSHMAGMDMPAVHAGESLPDDPPADHSSHTKDHCALSGLAVCAVFASALWTFADWDSRESTRVPLGDGAEPLRDASARWLTLRLHAPPSLA